MEIEIRWFAVVLATLSSFLVGGIWYAPNVFGETWRKLIKMDKKTMKKGLKPTVWATTIFAAFLQAFALAYITFLSYSFFDVSWMAVALMTALWLWMGLQVSMVLTHDAFEQRPSKLSYITMGNQLATLLVMGAMIGLFQP